MLEIKDSDTTERHHRYVSICVILIIVTGFAAVSVLLSHSQVKRVADKFVSRLKTLKTIFSLTCRGYTEAFEMDKTERSRYERILLSLDRIQSKVEKQRLDLLDVYRAVGKLHTMTSESLETATNGKSERETQMASQEGELQSHYQNIAR